MSRDINHPFVSTKAKPALDLPARPGLGRTFIRYELLNTIRKSVFWRNGQGLTATEAPTPGTGDEALYIRIEYEFDSNILIDFNKEVIDHLGLPESSPIRKRLEEKLNGLGKRPGFTGTHGRTFDYTLAVTREMLDRAGGAVYLRDLDMVVGYAEMRETALHPYSQPELLERMKQETQFCDVGNHQRLIWVDNTREHDSLWYHNGFGVFQIEPIQSPQLADGFYLYTQVGTSKKVDIKHLPLEEAVKEFMMHPTRGEAETFGKPDKAFQQRITQAEQELVLAKQEFAARKVSLERDAHALKQERDHHEQAVKDAEAQRVRLQAEMDSNEKRRQQDHEFLMGRLKADQQSVEAMRNAAMERIKFDNSMESMKRKDNSEYAKYMMDMFKAVVGLLSIGLSIYAIAQKSK